MSQILCHTDKDTMFTWIGITTLCVLIILISMRTPKSRFKLREADRLKNGSVFDRKSDTPTEDRTLYLPGIQINGAPHEILGVSKNATASEVKKAFRNLMKHYHPDKTGESGSDEWQEMQKIAAALNRAKAEMLKNRGRS